MKRRDVLVEGVLPEPPFPVPDCAQNFHCNGCYGVYCNPCHNATYNSGGNKG